MGRLRIIAGSLRGRRVEIPEGPTVRPTSERVREALFSILGPGAPGSRVLDAYAGSGLLGLEALSRGAEEVWFVEREPDVVRVLERNVSLLGVESRCTVLEGRTLQRLREGRLRGPFDLVLADPPYESAEATALLSRIRPSMSDPGRLVLERDARSSPATGPDEGLLLTASRRYGDTRLDFYSAGKGSR
jgi:16S rRNA (guanine966-N2)-methyltransferase